MHSAARGVALPLRDERIRNGHVDLRLVADQAPEGLAYGMLPLKPGGAFTFQTRKYVAHGTVVAVTAATAAAK